ncbi:MAG TPA: Na-translocating system protein MpsC family protein [Solirubrobacteraceae bacterium]|nr:Na-translocating system protein MpsC family protein [Solirubrobacteraceae bacterium]
MSVELVAHDSSSPSRPGRDAAVSSPLLEISTVMVGLYKEAFGRGPTKVRTTFAGPDTVVVVLEDGFTVAERTLLGLGEVEALRNSRLVVQEALEERARSAVEGALERPTLAFITGIDPRRGVAANVFTLQPAAVADAHQNRAPFRARAAR